jgi:hypothetical protein
LHVTKRDHYGYHCYGMITAAAHALVLADRMVAGQEEEFKAAAFKILARRILDRGSALSLDSDQILTQALKIVHADLRHVSDPQDELPRSDFAIVTKPVDHQMVDHGLELLDSTMEAPTPTDTALAFIDLSQMMAGVLHAWHLLLYAQPDWIAYVLSNGRVQAESSGSFPSTLPPPCRGWPWHIGDEMPF